MPVRLSTRTVSGTVIVWHGGSLSGAQPARGPPRAGGRGTLPLAGAIMMAGLSGTGRADSD
jgi:hypothetical protein